jgi:hypothetical protein
MGKTGRVWFLLLLRILIGGVMRDTYSNEFQGIQYCLNIPVVDALNHGSDGNYGSYRVHFSEDLQETEFDDLFNESDELYDFS